MSYFIDNQVLNKTIKKLRLPFLATIILGLLVHAFVFTNRLPNWDSMRSFYSPEQMDKSGRFFLIYANGISSYFELPWFNGILSLFYLAVIAVMITELFNIKSTLAKILTSAVVVSIPSITATFSYMYTADAYLFATMLTMISLVLAKKFRWGFLFSTVLIFIAVGIYQANLAVALSFIVLYLCYLIIMDNQPFKVQITQAGKLLFPVAVGMVVYLIYYKYKTTLGGVEITSYKGLDEAGNLSLADLPERIRYMFEYIYTYFLGGEMAVSKWNLYEFLNFLLILSLPFIVLFSFIKLSNKLYILPLLLLYVSFPFALFIIVYTSPSVEYHTIMTFSTAAVYMIPLLLMDNLLRIKPNHLRKFVVYSALILTMAVTINFAIISNIAYMGMEYRTDKTVNLLNRIAGSIEANPKNLDAKYLHVIGRPKLDSSIFEEKLKENLVFIQGTTERHALKGDVQIVNGLQNYIGLKYEGISYEERDRLNEYNEVKEMKDWPDKDSILLIEDTLIIKFPEK